MAEASIDIPMIAEKMEPETVGVERNSAKKVNSPNGRAKILSRYLRASPGSCHDYCKYGRKHGVEVKERIPLRKWIKVRQSEAQDLETAVSSAERRKKFVISPEPCQDSEANKHDDLDASKKEAPSSLKEVTASTASQEGIDGEIILEGIDVSVEEDPKGSILKPEESEASSVPRKADIETEKGKELLESSSNRKTSKISSKEVRKLVLGEKKVSGPPSIPLSPKRSLRRVSDVPTQRAKSLVKQPHLKSQSKVKNVEPEHTGNEDAPEKTLYVIESTLEKRSLEPTQDDAHTTQLAQSSTSATCAPPSSRKNSKSTTRIGSHASQSPPSPSLGKKGLRHTRHETPSTKPPLSSLQSSSSSISPSECIDGKENGLHDTSLHQTEVSEKKKKGVNSKTDQKKIGNTKGERRNSARRVGILASESKSSAAQKLKFRRGTILDLKPVDNTPRRLKFRRVKLLREIQNGKEDVKNTGIKSNEAALAESSEFGTKTRPEKVVTRNQNADGTNGSITARRRMRRKGTSEGEAIGTKTSSEKVIPKHQNAEVATRRNLRRREIIRSELSGASKTNSEKVVLRHQNMAGKKEVRSLFNNVIEETASKLVVTRKSKVKALVGAFETVISLQDAKPPATVGTS